MDKKSLRYIVCDEASKELGGKVVNIAVSGMLYQAYILQFADLLNSEIIITFASDRRVTIGVYKPLGAMLFVVETIKYFQKFAVSNINP